MVAEKTPRAMVEPRSCVPSILFAESCLLVSLGLLFFGAGLFTLPSPSGTKAPKDTGKSDCFLKSRASFALD